MFCYAITHGKFVQRMDCKLLTVKVSYWMENFMAIYNEVVFKTIFLHCKKGKAKTKVKWFLK
jgi:hypothetical protein